MGMATRRRKKIAPMTLKSEWIAAIVAPQRRRIMMTCNYTNQIMMNSAPHGAASTFFCLLSLQLLPGRATI